MMNDEHCVRHSSFIAHRSSLIMRVIIAAGGTGGHIFPGVAIARELKRRDKETAILFVGTPRGLESKIVPREGFELELIRVGALKGVSLFERTKSLIGLPMSFISALRLLRRFRPDVVIGVGGYSSGPVLLMAALSRRPTMVVEPNAMPGFTNRVLARFVDTAALTFEEAQKYFRGRGHVTGNPVRGDFADLKKKERGEKVHVLIFGGSQGAHAINMAMAEALPLLASKRDALTITHQTGERDFEEISRRYREAGFEGAEVKPFINDMAKHFERADVLVCRAGATTAAEVAAAGKAAIFIPFPFATDDHQRKNAQAFERAGAARMIVQKELAPERLAEEIIRLIERPEEIDRMEEASRALGRPDSAGRAVDLALSLIRSH
ncbi:MAG: undecaprenyldiphospho-muramoylpentapeptide beta-N-acetylglucosaminyltransferase [Blastocatellia bacterium]|nr:undecaprenyldiphospho-muramoylpentapeptide beta-N-acetylglucosaminyltransferase [Blastocatellia bacterium]